MTVRQKHTIAILLLSVAWAMSSTVASTKAADRLVDSDPIELSVSVDSETARVADPILLTCELTVPPGTSVQMTKVGAMLGPFEVVRRDSLNDVPTDGSDSERRWSQEFVLESLQTGRLSIPALQIQYRLAGQTEWRARVSDPIEIEITSLLEERADPTALRDLKPPVDIQIPESGSPTILFWALGGILGVGLFAFAIYAATRRSDESPDSWAIGEIEKLEQSDAVKDRDAIAVYESLSRIVRTYIEWRFGSSPSAERTHHIPSMGSVENDALASLHQLLDMADEVRFARLDHDQSQLQGAIERAKQLITSCESHETTRDHDQHVETN